MFENPSVDKNVTDSDAKFKQQYLSNWPELDACSQKLPFLTVADTVTSQIFYLPS